MRSLTSERKNNCALIYDMLNISILLFNLFNKICAVLHCILTRLWANMDVCACMFKCLPALSAISMTSTRSKKGLQFVHVSLFSLNSLLSLCFMHVFLYIFPTASSHAGSWENIAICFLDSLCSDSNSEGL